MSLEVRPLHAGIGMGGYASITNSQITANSVTVRAPGGTASAMFAALSAGNGAHTTTISHSTISGNRLHATTRTGSVVLQGAGVGHLNGGPLVLRDTTITHNRAAGAGPGGMAQGGGIWNGSLDPSSSLGPLRIIDPSITHNALGVPAGIATQGGGLFTAARPKTIRHNTILGNAPDQCHGC